MATGYYLSEEKMKLLNELLDERNPRWTKKTTSHSQPRQLFTSPEVFLCQAPDNDSDTNGVDGLTPAGDDDYDHPGSANCTICQIVPSTSADKDWDLVPIDDGIKQVFNYSESPIAKSDFFLAVKDKFGNWIAASSKSGLTPRILYDDIAPGDTDKNAWPVKDDMTADTDADKVLVQNTFPGNFRGYGDAHTGFDATTAAKVWTTVDSAGKEQIVFGKGLAELCRAVAKGAISGSTGTVDGVTVMDDGQSPVDSSSTELAVNNPWNFYLADDALCQLTRNGANWDITNVALIAETFDTDQQVTGLTIQHKTREIRVNPTGAESDWATWHTGDDCSA